MFYILEYEQYVLPAKIKFLRLLTIHFNIVQIFSPLLIIQSSFVPHKMEEKFHS